MIEKEAIEKYSWYRQGADVSPLFACMPYKQCFNIFTSEGFLTISEGLHAKLFFSLEITKKIFSDMISKQKKDKRFIDNYFSSWKSFHEKKFSLIDKFENKISNMSKEELFEILNKYFAIDYSQWEFSLLPEIIDGIDTLLIEQELGKLGIEMGYDFKKVLHPIELPYSSRIENDILKLKDPVKLSKKYHFIHNSWAFVTYLGSDFFEKEIKECKTNIKELEDYAKLRQEENTSIIKKYNIPKEIQNIFYFMQRAVIFRDERKFDIQRSSYFLDKVIRRIEAITGIDYGLLLFMMPDELKKSVIEGDKEILKKMETRKKNCACVYDGGMRYVEGADAVEIIDCINMQFTLQFKDITGRPAFNGVVKGKAKIILGKNDFHKFSEGDILVAPSTRPEYMPLMKKASAIVTDEGGVTCHAAIVSRELGLPCIIGTQVATELLFDGEEVEVDANKGVVRKI